jgi:uncharacterized membrane protein YfhO
MISALREYDTGFYRVEKNFQYTENDPLLFGYLGINHYSSGVNNDTMLFLEKLHMNRAGRIRPASGYDQNAPLSLDMLFGLKYFLISNAETGMWIDTRMDIDDVDIVENTYALPIGFMAEAKTDGNLFFTIPNDDGWTAKVDGKKVKTETAPDLFMAVPLSAGVHEIELKYTPKGLTAEFLVSSATLLVCAVYTAKRFWRQTERTMATVLVAQAARTRKKH